MRKPIPAFVLVLSTIIVLVSCGKKDSGCISVNPDSEKSQLISFCTANNISYTQHSSGLLYQILSQGTGTTPTLTSKIFITYRGTFMNGNVFDSLTNASSSGWPLSSLIEGMRIGVPIIQKGGHIKLVIPSSLAYGCNGAGTIPPNTPIFFDINLVDVQ
jgi:FKBP-type peptidyl-prolyl cis-trans isomerase